MWILEAYRQVALFKHHQVESYHMNKHQKHFAKYFLLLVILMSGEAFLLKTQIQAENGLESESRIPKYSTSSMLKAIGYHLTQQEPIDDVTDGMDKDVTTDHVMSLDRDAITLPLMLIETLVTLIDGRNRLAFPDRSVLDDNVFPSFEQTNYKTKLRSDLGIFLAYLNYTIKEEEILWGSIKDKSLSDKLRELQKYITFILCEYLSSSEFNNPHTTILPTVTVTNQATEQAFVKGLLLSLRSYLLGLKGVTTVTQ